MSAQKNFSRQPGAIQLFISCCSPFVSSQAALNYPLPCQPLSSVSKPEGRDCFLFSSLSLAPITVTGAERPLNKCSLNDEWGMNRASGEKSIRSLCGTLIALSVQLGERYHLWSQDMYLVGEITGPNKRVSIPFYAPLIKYNVDSQSVYNY